MPEGPEVRRQCDRLAAALAGRPTTAVWFAFPRLQRYAPALEGAAVQRVEPRGKAFVLRFEGGLCLYAHHQLYGRWRVRRSGERPQTRRQLRAVVENDRAAALLYSASDIEVLPEAELRAHPYLAKLGPDILDADTTAAAIDARLAEHRFRRRGLAALYLDQGFLAGNGNYLRSEMLFVAGLDPRRKAGGLDDDARRRLAEATATIGRRAYETGGITRDPESVAASKAAGLKRRAYRHFVFGRDGQPCPRCAAPIERSDMAGRRIYTCPRCQT